MEEEMITGKEFQKAQHAQNQHATFGETQNLAGLPAGCPVGDKARELRRWLDPQWTF